jgi:hypothetical protein
LKLSVQTDDFNLLKEAVDSNCSSVRFGTEFCELKIPNLNILMKAYDLVRGKEKKFIYVTPRLSNIGIDQIKKQFSELNDKEEMDIIINDFGTLNIIENYPNLHPRLGRLLIRIPARSPWTDIITEKADWLSRRWFKKIFSSTNLNYPLTIKLLKAKGVTGADMDWIPYTFSSLSSLTGLGLNLSIHLNLVPIAVTRRCHTARFVGEEDPEKCSKPCLRKAFIIKNEVFNLEFFILGNAVFRMVKPNSEAIEKLQRSGIDEFILTMDPVTGVNSKQKIDYSMAFLSSGTNK